MHNAYQNLLSTYCKSDGKKKIFDIQHYMSRNPLGCAVWLCFGL